MDAAAAPAPPLPTPQAPPGDDIKTEESNQHDLDADQVLVSETANGAPTEPPSDQNGSPHDPQHHGANTVATPMAAQQKGQSNGESGSADAVAGILRELTTSVGINAELQCTLCHEVLCKPVTTPCGHSFCRICLIEYLLSKELDETQCPICRGLVLHTSVDEGGDTGDNAAPVFCVNVTLWNLIQLLVPAIRDKDPADEDADYALKYDHFDAKWRIAALYQSAPNENRRRRQLESNDEIDSSGDEMEGAHRDEDHGSDVDGNGADAAGRRQRQRYPELRQENTVDGHLEVFRNVVVDRDDANEDGYEAMRVGLAVMEFPSLFQPFNEHQECSVAVLKCEEDEDMDAGIPFFTSDDGDDDPLIIVDYYNEIRLRVTDNVGNIVMERTRGATQGIATFPNLRLDVPSGMYDFQFKDDLYGVRLTIRTEVRALRDEDASSEIEEDGRAVRLILDQAGERTRSRRRRRHGDGDDDEDEDEDEASESGSDDSFIVNDEDDLEHEQFGEPEFSDDEGDDDEGARSNPDDEDEEAIMERTELARQEQLRRRRWGLDDQSSLSSQHELEDDHHIGAEGDEIGEGVSRGDHSDEEDHDEGQLSSVSSGRSAKRNHIVDDDSESEQSTGDQQAETTDWSSAAERDSTHVTDLQASRKRSRAIMESEDEHASDADEESKSNNADDEISGQASAQQMRGFSSNKRIRQLTSRMFQDDEDDDVEAAGEHHESRHGHFGDDEDVAEEEDGTTPRSRWIGSDPYSTSRQQSDASEAEYGDDDGNIADEATHDGYDAVDDDVHDDNGEASDHSRFEDEDTSWNAGDENEHDGEDDRYSE